MRKIIFLIIIFCRFASASGQNLDMGIFFGKFYTVYKYIDYGTGFRNVPASQYSVFPSIVLNKQYARLISAEIRASFIAYQQYIGTRLYSPNFYSVINGGNISLTANYSFIQTDRFEARVKGGAGIGLIPDMYEGEFIELFNNYPLIDSISRGSIKRNFTPIFPTLSLGLDFSYSIAKRFKLSVAGSYQKGFCKITEYDIYYNDGNGKNDQHAKQWGTGDFYGLQIGVRYMLKDKSK